MEKAVGCLVLYIRWLAFGFVIKVKDSSYGTRVRADVVGLYGRHVRRPNVPRTSLKGSYNPPCSNPRFLLISIPLLKVYGIPIESLKVS